MNRRNKAITLRVTDSEKTQLVKKAEKCGLSLSSYLRCAGLFIDEECCVYVNANEEDML